MGLSSTARLRVGTFRPFQNHDAHSHPGVGASVVCLKGPYVHVTSINRDSDKGQSVLTAPI